MSAREAILRRLGSGPRSELAAEARALLVGPERPGVAPDRLTETFIERLSAPSVAATVERIAGLSDVPAAVRRLLTEHAPVPALYVPPDPVLQALDWSGVVLDPACAVDGGAARAQASAAVAETGSLVLDTAATAPMLPNFLALHHIVVVRAGTLVAQLEDIPPLSNWPRARYWVTGVSGTTDIEGQYVRGAHGPRFLHVLLECDRADTEPK
jgi:L-lactate dehydrogenase complex protein LldG